MKIRPVTLQDANRIRDIYSPSVLKKSFSFETTLPTIAELQDRIKEYTQKYPWLVAEFEGRVVGYAYGSTYRTRCAYEWSAECSVYVDQEYFGQGIAKKLYQELFRLMKAQGVVNIFAGITQPNEPSVKLHESLGFVLVGRFKDVGYKLGKWSDVGWYQLQLQKPEKPSSLLLPTV